MNYENNGVFDEVRTYPDPAAQREFTHLIGLDEIKTRLCKEARLLLDPQALKDWAARHHKVDLRIVQFFSDRPPLFLFAGDIGTGKTALAESFGDAVAREMGVEITLFGLSLTARGTGAVGQMTSLLSSAFREVCSTAERLVSGDRPRGAVVLLIDEADALAQSREAMQMHHEDRAGVNALIRGVDGLANRDLPALVVMCTNRLEAIDPAVRRRAAATFRFGRPDEEQRLHLLKDALGDLGFNGEHLRTLAGATGPANGIKYGYTYSDFTHRFFPALVLGAFPDRAITPSQAVELVEVLPPTPPFRAEMEAQ